ncbi:GRM1 [Symbiodinium natans]|uniref:GRM1 protein n=1 Tax=Symbiodinium natans TaxID=878477 RepID=A0A812P0Z6_9DINO|nr:GRM1 [Symbiodinium natans]
MAPGPRPGPPMPFLTPLCAWPWPLVLASCSAAELAIGVLAPLSESRSFIAALAALDLDLRKHYEAALVARFGRPVLEIVNPHAGLQNVTFRMGTTNMQPEIGLATAMEFLVGLDLEKPVAGLIGAATSVVSGPLAILAGGQKVPQISFGATAPTLSNKESYPYFMRTIPPDSIQALAFWAWLVVFNVKFALCMYSDEAYGQGIFLALQEEAMANGDPDRVVGHRLRYTPQSFDVDEARSVALHVKSRGSRFLLVVLVNNLDRVLGVLEEEGMLSPSWQVLGSEYVEGLLPEAFPVGYMRMNPLDSGPKLQDFAGFWSRLTPEDVVGEEARSRYKLDNLKVPLEDSPAAPITDSLFTDVTGLSSQDRFLVDAGHSFLLAINSLLNQGVSLGDVRGQRLLTELRKTTFAGITGFVGFDERGDRASNYYNLLNIQVVQGRREWVNVGVFYQAQGELIISGPLTWMDGQQSLTVPTHFFLVAECELGLFQDDPRCQPCPRGFFCLGGSTTYQACPRGTFTSEVGMSNCTPCAVGHFASTSGSSGCLACNPGTHANRTGMALCDKCPKGTYFNDSAAVHCTRCPLNFTTEESGSIDISECECGEGTFLCAGIGCLTCPRGLRCPAGRGRPVQQAGYWSPPAALDQCSFSVLRCRNGYQCPPNSVLGVCPEGREGAACNRCKAGHYPVPLGICEACENEHVVFPVVATVVVTFLSILFLSTINTDLHQKSLSLLTVALIGGQLVIAVQALGSIQRTNIRWVPPVRDIIVITKLTIFEFDFIRISCIWGSDDPVGGFVVKLLACPAGLVIFFGAWVVARLRGRTTAFDALFNLWGMGAFALFIALTLTVTDPFLCEENPDGTWSLSTNPGIICFASPEHRAMVGLSLAGFICYPVAILTWAAYAIIMYPVWITTGAGLRSVSRHRFLFQRFRPSRYYYGVVVLLRNFVVALLPVLTSALPAVQVPLMGTLLVASAVLQVGIWPWRTKVANVADMMMVCFLQVVLLGAGPLLDIGQEQSSEVLGWLLCIAVLLPMIAGWLAFFYAVYRQYWPKKYFGLFLCHHKAAAGALCRLIKILVARYSSTDVFLDCDHLEDLGLLFTTLRLSSKNVVVVLTPDLLKRMWCAGEIVTAFKNKVNTVVMKCGDIVPLSTQDTEEINGIWTEDEKKLLGGHGISMDDVREAYAWLQGLDTISMPRFGGLEIREQAVEEMLSRCRLLSLHLSWHCKSTGNSVKPRILITGAVKEAEALSACEILQINLQAALYVECAVVQTGEETRRLRPGAFYFVVLLSRGMLRDPAFAEILISSGAGSETASLEIVTVVADAAFQFPGAKFYTELEKNGLETLGPNAGPRLAKAYRAMTSQEADFRDCPPLPPLQEEVRDCSPRLSGRVGGAEQCPGRGGSHVRGCRVAVRGGSPKHGGAGAADFQVQSLMQR